MLISPAFAQGGGAPGGFGGIEGLLPFILIAVVFYFLLIRPQQKRQKEHRNMVANLRRGDQVVTAGGIIGTISKVTSETEVVVEIAENVKVKVARATITEVLSKPQPSDKSGGGASSGSESPKGSLLDSLLGRRKG